MKAQHAYFSIAILAVLMVGGASTVPSSVASAAKMVAPAPSVAPSATPESATGPNVRRETDDERLANQTLVSLAKKYQHLDGVTVQVAKTPKGEQAVAYYTKGQIVVNTAHTVGIQQILAHEVWHVIDWRDNGRLDWGEDLPPRNASTYLK